MTKEDKSAMFTNDGYTPIDRAKWLLYKHYGKHNLVGSPLTRIRVIQKVFKHPVDEKTLLKLLYSYEPHLKKESTKMTKRLTEEEFNTFINSNILVSTIDIVYRSFETGDNEESCHGEFSPEFGSFNEDVIIALSGTLSTNDLIWFETQGKIFYRNPKLVDVASVRILALLHVYVHHIDIAKKDFGLWDAWVCDDLNEIDNYEAYNLWFDDFYDAKGLDEIGEEITEVCEVCKKRSKIFVEYLTDKMCPPCARKSFEHDMLKEAIKSLERLLEMNVFKNKPIVQEKCGDLIVKLKSCIPWDSHAKNLLHDSTPGKDLRGEKGVSMI